MPPISLDVADFGCDGYSEIFVASSVRGSTNCQVLVVDHSGNLIAESDTGPGARDLKVIQSTASEVDVFFSLDGKQLVKWGYDGQSFKKSYKAQFPTHRPYINLISDLAPNPGDELLVGSRGGHFWVLGSNFETLGHIQNESYLSSQNSALVWHQGTEEQAILLPTPSPLGGVEFLLKPTPRSIPIIPLTTAGAFGLGGSAAFFLRRRKLQSSASIRELRIQLIGRLKLANHGAIGSLSSLRRLLWTYSTCAEGFGLDRSPKEIYSNWGRECLEIGIPDLVASVELAEMAGIDESVVKRARNSAINLAQILKHLESSEFDVVEVKNSIADLKYVGDETEASFKALRHEAECAFKSNPIEIFQRSLKANEGVIGANKVKVELPKEPTPFCRVDGEEMAFVLDNLVENALEAMKESLERKLKIDWEVEGSFLRIYVTDTGCGIIPDDWSRLMKPGSSKRKGRGLGLPCSQDILRKYGGSLAIKSSEPGKGTTFVVVCPVAQLN
jgi:signal transduction histidine kinase